MLPEDVRELILGAFPDAVVEVQDLTGTGDHFAATIVSERFSGLPMIKQHRLVNQALLDYLEDGRIHALALKTFSPEQWQRASVQLES